MQVTEIPKKVSQKMDQITRYFLWGDTDEKKKIRLLN